MDVIIYMFYKFSTLGSDLRYALEKNRCLLMTWPLTILNKNLWTLYKVGDGSAACTVDASFYCFEISYNRRELSSKSLLAIYLVFLYSVHWAIHKVSRAITKRKEHSLSFRGWQLDIYTNGESFIFGGRSKNTVLQTILLFCPFSWHLLLSWNNFNITSFFFTRFSLQIAFFLELEFQFPFDTVWICATCCCRIV